MSPLVLLIPAGLLALVGVPGLRAKLVITGSLAALAVALSAVSLGSGAQVQKLSERQWLALADEAEGYSGDLTPNPAWFTHCTRPQPAARRACLARNLGAVSRDAARMRARIKSALTVAAGDCRSALERSHNQTFLTQRAIARLRLLLLDEQALTAPGWTGFGDQAAAELELMGTWIKHCRQELAS